LYFLNNIDSGGNYFSILEYASKGNLRNYLKDKRGKLQWKEKIQIGLEVTRGLMYLHSKKMIHGNLVNNNLILDSFEYLTSHLKLILIIYYKAFI
jgi:serine/threonine protein kinase